MYFVPWLRRSRGSTVPCTYLHDGQHLGGPRAPLGAGGAGIGRVLWLGGTGEDWGESWLGLGGGREKGRGVGSSESPPFSSISLAEPQSLTMYRLGSLYGE